MIEFRDVAKSYDGIRALGPVSFALRPGTILGLIGENGAGKSTLMNLLAATVQPDAGQMVLGGQVYRPREPGEALYQGVALIHQELNLFPNLSIAENLFLTRFPRHRAAPFIQRRALHAEARQLLAEVGLDLDPGTLVERLSPGESQLVEIARALGAAPRLILFDEPTTSLGSREAERLFELMVKLRRQGISMIYVSHTLPDVRRLCDDLVVLRDGLVVGEGPVSEFSLTRMISLMVGRELDQLYPTRAGVPQTELALEVRGIAQPGVVRDISFQLRRGEILGLAGLLGAGRSELARVLFGLERPSGGEIRLDGNTLLPGQVRRRIQRGMAYLTEDRRTDGLCLNASLVDNVGLVVLPRYASAKTGRIDRASLRRAITTVREAVRLSAKAADRQPVRTLSGGNQQKVVLGKWLLARPRVLILDEPTRGIDVGAKFEIYRLIQAVADQGAGVLLISSELEELLGLCDRILVMSRGEITDTLSRDEFDQSRILRSALAHTLTA